MAMASSAPSGRLSTWDVDPEVLHIVAAEHKEEARVYSAGSLYLLNVGKLVRCANELGCVTPFTQHH